MRMLHAVPHLLGRKLARVSLGSLRPRSSSRRGFFPFVSCVPHCLATSTRLVRNMGRKRGPLFAVK